MNTQKRLERDAEIIAAALAGESLAAIGVKHDLSRQGVLMIVRKAGAEPGAILARAQKKIAKRQTLKQDGRSVFAERFGMSKERWRELVAAGVTAKWQRLRANCFARGIGFELSLSEFADITKGFKLGRKAGEYVVAQRDQSQPYRVGNVILRTASSNCRLTRTRDTEAPRTAVATGVYLLHPGREKKYRVIAHKKLVGHFATVEEAVAARNAVLQAAA